METTRDFMERLRARNGGCSNYHLAKILQISDSCLVRYTKDGKSMADSVALKVADQLGIDPAYVFACMAAERANDVESTRIWERIAEKFIAASLTVMVCMPLIHWHL